MVSIHREASSAVARSANTCMENRLKAHDKNLCTNLMPNILVSVCCYFYLKHLSLGSVTCKWVEGPPSGNEDGSASTVVCPGRF